MVNTDNKIKVNPGLASIILVGCLFAGWQTLLIVAVLMFFFCDIDEKVKQVAISVITFYVGLTIVTMGIDIIVGIAEVIVKALEGLTEYIRTSFDADVEVLRTLITPLSLIVKLTPMAFDCIIMIAKLGFVIGILTGTPAKQNPLSSKINEYVNKAINYVNGNISVNMMPQQPMPPMGAQVQPNMGMPNNGGMQQPLQSQPMPQQGQAPMMPQNINNNQNR